MYHALDKKNVTAQVLFYYILILDLPSTAQIHISSPMIQKMFNSTDRLLSLSNVIVYSNL